MPAGAPDAAPAAVEARAAPTAQAPRRLGLALVIRVRREDLSGAGPAPAPAGAATSPSRA